MVKRAESSALLCTFGSSPLREDIMAVAGYRGRNLWRRDMLRGWSAIERSECRGFELSSITHVRAQASAQPRSACLIASSRNRGHLCRVPIAATARAMHGLAVTPASLESPR